MGSVWSAVHEQLDAPVAVKVMATNLEPSLIARFEREAKACARLASPHLVKVHDFGALDGAPFMVMELLEGEDLGSRLKREGALSVETVAGLLRQIAKGLAVAHAAGIIHRDLKPANIFLAKSGRDEIVKVLDFGVARETETSLVEDRTTSGVILGSPHFMSPEQAAGEAVDGRSDLWSLGVIAYQALTGRRPFEGTTLTAVLLAITTREAPRPSTILKGADERLDAFFVRAFARHPANRFQSSDEMVDAFDKLAVTQGGARAPTVSRSDDEAPTIASQPHAAAELVPTGSQALRAVASGVTPSMVAPRRRWVLPVVLAVAGSAAAVVYYLRTEPPSAPASSGVPTASAPAERALASSAGVVAPVIESAAPAASPVTSATAAAPTATQRVPAQPRPPKTAEPQGPTCPPNKRYDAFSGLCVTKR